MRQVILKPCNEAGKSAIEKGLIIILTFLWASMATQNAAANPTPFFPLQTGNKWQYEVWTTDEYWWLQTFSHYELIEIAGDTIMPNGKRYYKMTTFTDPFMGADSNEYAYFRTDTLNLKVYKYDLTCLGSETVHFDLDLPDSSGTYHTCDSEGPIAYEKEFGRIGGIADSVRSITYSGHFDRRFWGGYYEHKLTVSDSIGISEWWLRDLPGGAARFLIYAEIDSVQYGNYANIREAEALQPQHFMLSQNYPNPFNPVTTIAYHLPTAADVSLKIYTILGQEVMTLAEGFQSAGYKTVQWNGKDKAGRSVASGIYLYKLQAGGMVQTRKMLLAQ